MTGDTKQDGAAEDQDASKAMIGLPLWLDAFDGNVPTFKLILVANASGFVATVNEVIFNNTTREFSGYMLTPEGEDKVISGITHWARIET